MHARATASCTFTQAARLARTLVTQEPDGTVGGDDALQEELGGRPWHAASPARGQGRQRGAAPLAASKRVGQRGAGEAAAASDQHTQQWQREHAPAAGGCSKAGAAVEAGAEVERQEQQLPQVSRHAKQVSRGEATARNQRTRKQQQQVTMAGSSTHGGGVAEAAAAVEQQEQQHSRVPVTGKGARQQRSSILDKAGAVAEAVRGSAGKRAKRGGDGQQQQPHVPAGTKRSRRGCDGSTAINGCAAANDEQQQQQQVGM